MSFYSVKCLNKIVVWLICTINFQSEEELPRFYVLYYCITWAPGTVIEYVGRSRSTQQTI